MVWIGLGIFILLFAIPLAGFLEQTMFTHLLIEFPLLILAGYCLIEPVKRKRYPWLNAVNKGGIAGLLIVSFTLIFWMIPKWLDYSLTFKSVAYYKYFSMTFLVGSCLSLSWKSLHPIIAALAKIELLTMLIRLGWIYLISPERLCNNYLLNDQIQLGKGCLIVALVLAIIWMIPLFIQKPRLAYN